MAIISQTISPLSALVLVGQVDRTDPASVQAFQDAWEAFNTQLKETTVGELNTAFGQVNSVRDEVNTLRNTVVDKEALMNPHYDNIDAVATNIANVNIVGNNIVAVQNAEANANLAVTAKTDAESARDIAVIARDEAVGAVASLPDGTINDTQTTLTNTWSASKIEAEITASTPILAPIITAPLNGAVDFIGEITSTYTTNNSYAGAQDFVRWEASTSADFSTLVDSYEGASNLTTWTPSIGMALTEIFIRTKQGSDGHRSNWSSVISFTTPNIFIETPTLTVTGTPSDVPETPTLTTSAFSVFNGTDTHVSTTFTVKDNLGAVVWTETKTTGDLLTTTVPAGILSTSTTYTFEAYHTGATYGSSSVVSVGGTTKAAFSPMQGQKGFGIEPCPAGTPFALLGLSEMTGTNEVGHDNYGNYIHSNGSIVCHYIKKYYRIGHPDSPRYAVYGENAIEMVPIDTFADEAEANAAGWVLHRAFIDGDAEKTGFFRDKYINSQSATDANIAVSVKNGVPISLTTSTSYTRSSTMTGCTGILADAVTLCRARGEGWNNESSFMVGWSSMISIAQAQMANSTDDVAWYDASLFANFPKGCNNNALSDINDTSVTWTSAGDAGSASKPLAGSASNFAKSTDNGANNGCADVNGSMLQVSLGVTNIGTSATSTIVISTNTIYVLKRAAFLKDLTAGWDGATDAWGNTTNLSTRYDAVTSPIDISTAGGVYWGSGANQVLSPDTSGVAHALCGFFPKNDTAADATGTSQFGNDLFNKYNRHNMYVRSAGDWSNSAAAGSFYRLLSSGRSSGSVSNGFRGGAYV